MNTHEWTSDKIAELEAEVRLARDEAEAVNRQLTETAKQLAATETWLTEAQKNHWDTALELAKVMAALAASEAARERVQKRAEEIADEQNINANGAWRSGRKAAAEDILVALSASPPAQPPASEAEEIEEIAAIMEEYDLDPIREFLADRAPAPSRDAVLEEARQAVAMSAWKHVGNDAYSQGMDVGARHQIDQCLAAIDALKRVGQG